ncbi:hypothetical protein [Bradyrhizobium sp. USDA 313]|uniref:hypothetical protein n=1 Tax=Bradyrhizobium sp. USDA 313 TaxID=3156307 RepID=UPI003514ADCD
MTLAGFGHITLGGLPVMVQNANADDNGKAARAPSMPMARDPAVAVAEEYEAAPPEGNAGSLRALHCAPRRRSLGRAGARGTEAPVALSLCAAQQSRVRHGISAGSIRIGPGLPQGLSALW